ncbi:MAG TPA: acyl-CoA dehydrogenase family protein, partial [Acidimicrobiales bacterium]|nr:acyl-CoA dehydrogenase family protein [Acidimicrobiales bacterium]
MHFGFDDDQIAFRDAVRDLLDKECPPEAVRAAWEAPVGALDRGVWDRLADMGVLATLVPEGGGGLGLDERSL